MSQENFPTNASETTKRVVISILFSSISLGLLGGLVIFVKASTNPIPVMIFGFVTGLIGGVLANLGKIREVRESRASLNNHSAPVGQAAS